jgi:TatD DNase family protein
MLVDSHCHLNYKDFPDEDVAKSLQNAKDNNIQYILTVAADYESLPDVTQISSEYKNVFAAFGIHPEYAGKVNITEDELKKILSSPKFIGVGETGLDFFYEDAADLQTQQNLFVTHINVARETGLPLIIHSRNADKETIDILSAEMKNGEFKAELHCFCGCREMAFSALDLGLYISASGIITFGKKSQDLCDVFREIPLDRLLVETDSPYLAPTPKRGGRNEPAFVRFTAQKLAELKNVDIEIIEEYTSNNFFTLFSKAEK